MTGTVLEGMAEPHGRYLHIKRAGDLLFVSGTSSRRPDKSFAGAFADDLGSVELDIRVRTRAVIENIATILASRGTELSNLVELSAFLVNMNNFKGYNENYAEFFGHDGLACTTTVAVHELPHPHILIEIKAVAYAP